MGLDKQPFTRYDEEKQTDSFTVRLNESERKQLESDKKILNQPKDSTALKTLAKLGSIVIQRDESGLFLQTVLGNRRRNERLGIVDYEG